MDINAILILLSDRLFQLLLNDNLMSTQLKIIASKVKCLNSPIN